MSWDSIYPFTIRRHFYVLHLRAEAFQDPSAGQCGSTQKGCRMSKQEQIKSRDRQDLENISIFELIRMLGDIRRALRHPTSKQLAETGGEPVTSSCGCTVYPNGYIRYERDGMRTVIWLPDCTEYTCWFVQQTGKFADIVPDRVSYDLSEFPWMYAVILRGEARIDQGLMHLRGDRMRIDCDVGENPDACKEDAYNVLDAVLDMECVIWRGCVYIPGPEETVIIRETIREALSRLTEEQRHIVLEYYYEGYTLEEIGKEYGTSAAAVQKRIQRVCSQLQNPDMPDAG